MGIGILGSFIFIAVVIISPIRCEEEVQKEPRFSIFQIIKFQNGPCRGAGGTRNGTCYTDAECKNQGGTKDGDCADGFGVCCITMLKSGATTALNQSYIVHSASSATTLESGTYTICPCSEDVCRIRFDFTMFTLAGPFTGDGNVNANQEGWGLGDCATDTFSITGANGGGTPVICGENTGQHVIVDSNGDDCTTVNLGVGTGGPTRALDIMVTQYRCGDEMGGPRGCLQWMMTSNGRINSFNYPRSITPGAYPPVGTTHLSNQMYDICIRQPAGATHICYIECTWTVEDVAAMAGSFGISTVPTASAIDADAGKNTDCTSDYITITGGDTVANAAMADPPNSGLNRFCGRALYTDNKKKSEVTGIAILTSSVCTASLPFRVGVHFDQNEVTGANTDGSTHELKTVPGGIIGFSLCYTTLPA